jgi:hypothetical protein
MWWLLLFFGVLITACLATKAGVPDDGSSPLAIWILVAMGVAVVGMLNSSRVAARRRISILETLERFEVHCPACHVGLVAGQVELVRGARPVEQDRLFTRIAESARVTLNEGKCSTCSKQGLWR